MFGVMQRGELRHGAADCGLRVCRAARCVLIFPLCSREQ